MVAQIASLLPKAEFMFTVNGAQPAWRMRRFELHEALSAPYHCSIDLVSLGDEAIATSLLGASCTVTVLRGPLKRTVHGVVFRVEDLGTANNHVCAHVELAPALWVASEGTKTRIFQAKAAPEIVAEVLKEPLATFHRTCDISRLSRKDYAQREFCVQFDESDLAFVTRLLAEEGISYFFDQSGNEEVMVLVDSNEAYPACATLDDNPVPASGFTAAAGQVECLFDFASARRLGTTRAAVHKYDWTRPSVPFNEKLERKAGDGPDFEIYDHAPRCAVSAYGEGDLKYTKEHLKERARVGLERAQVRHSVHTGTSNVTGLFAGAVLETRDHALSDLCQKYLVIGVHHSGRSSEDLANRDTAGSHREDPFRNILECVPLSVPFRPELPARHPQALGIVTATVVGPPNEEIFTDAHGRVKVRFHWDRRGPSHDPRSGDSKDQDDVNSSCWVRVAQSWAGPGFGTIFLPRIGMEVVVQFSAGDPDRPIITGCLYNGQNPPPLDLPAEKTRSTLRTASSPGSMGSNEIRFEDAKDSEELYIHAQKDMNETVLHDHTRTVNNDETITVHGNQAATVDKNQTVTVHGTHDETVDKKDTVTLKDEHEATVTKKVTQTYRAEHELTVKGPQEISIQTDKTEHVQQAYDLTTDKKYSLTQGTTNLTLEGNKATLTAGGGDIEINSATKITLVCGNNTIVLSPSGIEVNGVMINVEATGITSVKGSMVNLN